jgi:hypothetical protein
VEDYKKKYKIMKENAETLAKRIDKAIEIIEKSKNKAPIEVILNDISKALKVLKGEI